MTMRALSILLLLGAMGPALAAEEPVQRELSLVHVFEGAQTEHIFVIGAVGFKTVTSLKEHLATWPAGSEIKWAPGCERFGNEPLLSSEKDLADFRAFLAKHGIKLVMVPSG